MKFKATEIGFQDGVGGASNSQSEEEYHYILFGVQEDERHPSNSGIYFEYDDQTHGGVNQVDKVFTSAQRVEFALKDGERIVVDCSDCSEKWDEFIAGIHATFPKTGLGPHIEAEIEFLSTDAGGRKKPVISGYRPQFFYAGHDWDAEHQYPDVDQVNPGDTVRTILRFLSPHEHWGKVTVGMPFLIREGVRTIAFGKVTRILENFEQDAKTIREEEEKSSDK